jgi:hypothetical protein
MPAKKAAAITPSAEKPAAPVPQNMGLPEGSVYQPTGHRRPLIVFPK